MALQASLFVLLATVYSAQILDLPQDCMNEIIFKIPQNEHNKFRSLCHQMDDAVKCARNDELHKVQQLHDVTNKIIASQSLFPLNSINNNDSEIIIELEALSSELQEMNSTIFEDESEF